MPYKNDTCEKSPDALHVTKEDKEDTRFRMCAYCGETYYCTDEDLLGELRQEGLIE